MNRVCKSVVAFAMTSVMVFSNLAVAFAAGPAWDPAQVYNKGDQISYEGKDYEAQWWTRNEVPGSSAWGAWKEMEDESAGATQWSSTKVYTGGMQAVYNGVVYEAKWWTQGQKPDTSYDWKEVGKQDGGQEGGQEGGQGGGEVAPNVEVSSVVLSESALDLLEGERATVNATVLPENATDKTVTWATSNAAVAVVNNGTITAKGAGVATITAKAGAQSAAVVVTVAKDEPEQPVVIPVESVLMNRTSANLVLGQTETISLKATVLPQNATDKTVAWSSNNTAVAVVKNGVVTAKAAGTAVITAKAGGKTATCAVKVTVKETEKPEIVPVASVSVTPAKATLEMGKTETITLKAVVNPKNATDKTIVWSSNNTAVAVVKNGVVTAKSAGFAVITAKAGDKTASCTVKVIAKETEKPEIVPVASVTVTPAKATLEMGKTESVTLKATVNPKDATDKTVAWSSDNTAVAVVKNGVVTAKAAGIAVITAKAGDKLATCSITVKAAEENEGNKPSGEFKQTTNINGVKYPGDYWNRKVVGYFPNYAINSENHAYFSITDLQWDKLTHVQYAFVVADENTYEMIPSDPVNDVENKFEGRKFYHKGQEIKMDPTLGYYGQFNLMHTMMEKYPDVTVLASTGGWAASRSLWKVTDNEANMRKFAKSAVDFVRKYGFDGIDIDFEYPSETSQSGNPADFDLSEPRRKNISLRYGQLIKILREEFDAAAKQDGKYYWVTSAVTGSSWVLGGQTDASYLDYLDFVSVMSYDYHGGWNQYVENQANIYPDPADTETKAMAVPTLGFDWSYKYYRGGVQSEKILMGIPFYTRGWDNVSGGVNGLHGSSKTPAVGINNIWHDLDANGKEIPAGANPLWHVLNLMNEEGSHYKKYWDPVGCVPHVWNDQTRTFLTFEDEQSIQERINYIGDHNLGGCLIWVMHGDYDYDAAQDKYVVGDTLTSMLNDQLGAMAPAKLTSDIDVTTPALDFDVQFGGKYDHPNYTYEITVTNHTGENFDKWNVSFDIPNSAVYGSSWGGTATTKPSVNPGFTTVTLTPGWQKLPNGGSVTLQGMIKLNFAGVKNFKLNGSPMKSEVEAEIARVYRG